jgi:uncharacterized protein
MKIIDMHTHIGKSFYGRKPLTTTMIIETMDKNGIDQSIVLPIENPEETYWYHTTDQVIRKCKRYPERLIPFCCVDPRRGCNNADSKLGNIIEEYVKKGCKGFGEILASLNFNEPRMKNLYRFCGKFNLPVVFHLGGVPGKSKIGLADEIGLPYMEETLEEFPEVNFIGHGQGFWAEISAEVTAEERNSYPKGKIKKEGKAAYLLKNYPNLYGDLSAGSGYNALTRDKEYGLEFLKKLHKKLLFATDYLFPGQELNIVKFMKEVNIPAEYKKSIMSGNAQKLLRK